jgi:lipopolysaccharide export system protein LptA
MLNAMFSLAQKQIGYKADKIKFLQSYKGGAKRLIGNVQFTHENMVMTCDSSYFLDNNTIEAFSNIVIHQGDSLRITGNNAKYDGNTKLGLIEGNVICTEKDMTLTTQVLSFDVKNSLASYTTGGTIVSKDNTLTSQHGYYHSPSKSVSFKYDVRLVNPEYVMTADTLKYLTVSKTAVFLGPTNIKSKKDNLYCEEGWYNTQTQISHLTKNAVIYSGQNILHADSIHYDKKKESGYAFSNVRVIDNQEKIIINGDKAYTNQKKNLTWITGKTLLEKFLKDDTLYASADTIWAYEKSIPVKKEKKAIEDSIAKLATDSLGKRIKADSIQYLDSTVVRAYHHVKVYKRDMQGIADSLLYSAYDSSATLIHKPLLWYKQSQLSGKKITVFFKDNKVSRLHIPENTFMVEEADSIHYSQIKGKELWGYFRNDSSQTMDITGNVQAVYYLKNDKKKLQGANTIESSNVKIISEKKSTKVTFVKKPKAKIIPIKDVKPKELELKGFTWQIEKRPKNKEDLLK